MITYEDFVKRCKGAHLTGGQIEKLFTRCNGDKNILEDIIITKNRKDFLDMYLDLRFNTDILFGKELANADDGTIDWSRHYVFLRIRNNKFLNSKEHPNALVVYDSIQS